MHKLTPKEREIIALLAQGNTLKRYCQSFVYHARDIALASGKYQEDTQRA